MKKVIEERKREGHRRRVRDGENKTDGRCTQQEKKGRQTDRQDFKNSLTMEKYLKKQFKFNRTKKQEQKEGPKGCPLTTAVKTQGCNRMTSRKGHHIRVRIIIRMNKK